ncbi:hypothetical protein [Granulicella sibirica]|uniref:Uncharacterized protein n=1 Tax=Granulicella sibirica TaxID=2479048 RepID=A0A4Q0SWL1_9BACT|nr:hypothetical protein [Granulicella sibirica]RXH55473.1 hypothetical protein GRAN_2330 [Granulicella sibirica]
MEQQNGFHKLLFLRKRNRRALLRQVRREAGLGRLRRDNARLQVRFSRTDRVLLIALTLLMILAMAIGAYLGHSFKDVILDD